MLRDRVISGVLVAALLLAAIIGLSNRSFGLVIMILFILAGWEWAGLTSLKKPPLRIGYTAALAVVLLWLWSRPYASTQWLLAVSCVIWALLLAALAAYVHRAGDPPRWQAGLALLGLILLPAAWLAFARLHAAHYLWLIYFLTLCVTADSMAYLTGKLWGRNKLAVNLSPGKTREGLFGGLAGVFALSIVAALAWQHNVFDAISLVFLSLITGLISVEGDLFESLLKREAGVKDSGTLLPGHGGVLDRFDSHIAASPVFFLGLNWIIS